MTLRTHSGLFLILFAASAILLAVPCLLWAGNGQGPGFITITTTSPLPNGMVGQPYSQTLEASGGFSPYIWQSPNGPPPGLTLSSAGVLSGTPTTAGTYLLQVDLTDSSAGFGYGSLAITISPSQLTFVTPSPLPAATTGTAYSLTFSASGGTPPYIWSTTGGTFPSGMTLALGGTLSGTPITASSYDFGVRVTDSLGETAQRNYYLVVNPGLAPLVITSKSPLPAGTLGQAYSYTFQASGGTQSHSWAVVSGSPPAGILLASNGTLSGTPTVSGTSSFGVRVSDSQGHSATGTFALTIPANVTITITSTSPLATAVANVPYAFAFQAQGGTAPYTWSSSGTLPPGLSLATDGSLSGTPTTAGAYSFIATAVDANSIASASKPFELTVVPPLTITSSSPLTGGAVQRPYTFSFTATGGIGPYSWSIVTGSLPAGITITAATGILSGTPTAGGTFEVEVRVTDSRSNSASAHFTLAVTSPPVITTRSVPNGSVNQPFNFTFTATDGKPPYQWQIVSGVPPYGLNLSDEGILAGTPGAPGPSTLTVRVTDSSGAADSVTVTFRIVPAALVVTTPSLLPQAIINRPYSQTLAAQGGVPPYTWSLGSGSLPAGVIFSAGGEIRGIPTALGTFDFTVTMVDTAPSTEAHIESVSFSAESPVRDASSSFPFRLVVTAPPIEITTTSPLPDGIAGLPYLTTLVATGGRAALSWSVTSGALPPGLTLDPATGAISGTATLAAVYTFTVQARDNIGPSALRPFTLAVRDAADLILSAQSVTFRVAAGGSTPPPQSISVVSRLNLLTGYRVTAEGAGWLRLISGSEASTPGRFVFGVNPAGQDPGSYEATIRVEALNTRQVIAVPVSLEVVSAPPALTLSPDLLRLNPGSPGENPAPMVQARHAGGGGSLDFTARVVEGAAFLSVLPARGTLAPDGQAPLRVSVISSSLPSGFARGVVRVTSAVGTTDIPVSIANPSAPRQIRLEPDGTLVSARQGNGASRGNRSFVVLNQGNVPLDYTAEVVSNTAWLGLKRQTGSVPAGGADTVEFAVNPATLPEGAYYGRIRLSAPAAQNSPLDFIVVLQVLSADRPPVPNVAPAGLVFVASEGGDAPAAQTVDIHTSSNAPVPYQAAIYTEDRGNWLAADPATGSTSTESPGALRITASPSSLKRGVYTGRVNVSLSSIAVRSIQVTMIVTPAALRTEAGDPSLAGCTPARMVATHSGLAGNFSSPVAWPTPLAVRLHDDCGEAVSSAQVVATFSSGDPPLTLRLTNPASGLYSATWVPTSASGQLTITANATAPSLASTSAEIIGAVEANRAPLVGRSAVLHSFYPQTGGPLAPGTLVQILGQDLATGEATASFPAPDALNNVTVLIGGRPAPLLYVSPTQINAQIPFGLAVETSYQVLISSGLAVSVPRSLDLNPVQPGIAANADATAIAQRADGSPVTAATPAKPGSIVSLFLSGLGATTIDVPAGSLSPGNPPALARTPVAVSIGGIPAEVLITCLAPGLVGVYQVEVRIPEGLAPGIREVVLEQGGTRANIVRLSVGE